MLGTRDHDVVRCVGFAVGAKGAEGIMVRLAFVFIRPVPWIYTDDAREIARAEMIDQDRFAVRNDKRAAFATEFGQGFGDG